jgi:hypothetical protein
VTQRAARDPPRPESRTVLASTTSSLRRCPTGIRMAEASTFYRHDESRATRRSHSVRRRRRIEQKIVRAGAVRQVLSDVVL